jgi:hypothetical protein
MHVKLDGMELIKREAKDGVVSEIRSIHNLSVYGKRRIVELSIPGSVGNAFQDMGRNPMIIAFTGEFIGPNMEKLLESLSEKFETKKPVPFSSDVALINSISEVVIENFGVQFESGVNLGVRYSMVLKEHASTSTKTSRGPGETLPPSQKENSKGEIEHKIDKMYAESRKSEKR